MDDSCAVGPNSFLVAFKHFWLSCLLASVFLNCFSVLDAEAMSHFCVCLCYCGVEAVYERCDQTHRWSEDDTQKKPLLKFDF